jgi:hypothetical protein
MSELKGAGRVINAPCSRSATAGLLGVAAIPEVDHDAVQAARNVPAAPVVEAGDARANQLTADIYTTACAALDKFL